MVVIFGLMGTGKTTLARDLGEALGWPVIHSDAVRKTLAGLTPTTPTPVEFGKGIYDENFSRRTYEEMRCQAGLHLAAGRSVILDGSYKRTGEREGVRQLAQAGGARALFVYCDCPAAVVKERLGLRAWDPKSISDGRLELMEAQAKDFDPLMPEDRPLLRLDTGRELPAVLAELKSFIQPYLDPNGF